MVDTEKKMDRRVTVNFDQETFDAVKHLATAQNKTVSDYVRALVAKDLKKRAKK